MRKLLLAALLPLSANAATWDFTIDGLVTFPTWYGDMTQEFGYFTATDQNKDGAISLGEVTAFGVAGCDIVPIQRGMDPLGGYQSALQSFSFAQGVLSFKATDGFSMRAETGSGIFFDSYWMEWRPGTTITVTPRVTEVPEPASMALLLVGLMTGAAIQRHRSKA